MTETAQIPVTRSLRRAKRGWFVFGIGLLLAIGSAVAWNNGLRDQVVPRNFGVVEDGRLY